MSEQSPALTASLAGPAAEPIAESEVRDPQTGRLVGYLYEMPAGGFVLVAADDVLPPVLISNESGGRFSMKPPFVRIYLGAVARCIAAEVQALPEVKDAWQRTLTEGYTAPAYQVGPLLTTAWNQTWPYNAKCPQTAGARWDCNGRCLVGCVAVAVGQVMRYWRWPPMGVGSHSYTWNGQILSADFETAYDWDHMPYILNAGSSQAEIDAVSTLLYHVGVGVEMQYGANGSAAPLTWGNHSALAALKTYFRYSALATAHYADSYDAATWCDMLRGQLEAEPKMPLPYAASGYDENGKSISHAFVVDGVRGDGTSMEFHLNLGWGADSLGWYYYPAFDIFYESHRAIFNLCPAEIPDLVVADIAVWPSTPSAGQTVRVTATIQNVGRADAGPFRVSCWKDLGFEPVFDVGDSDDWTAVNGLAASESIEVQFEVTYDSAGQYQLWVLADSLDAVDEASEANNAASVLVNVERPKLANLVVIQDVEFSPDVFVPGQPVDVTVTVMNMGQAGAGPFTVGLFPDFDTYPDVPWWLGEDVQYLSPGQSIRITFKDVIYSTTGRYTMLVWADVWEEVDETNEDDNYAFVEVQVVETPNLTVTRFWADSQPQAGDPVTLHCVVANTGQAAADNVSVALWKNASTKPGGSIMPDRIQTIGTLQPGQSVQVDFADVVYDSEGTYKAWVAVDPDDLIDEAAAEGDNYASLTVQVLPPRRPDLAITAIALGPPSPIVGQQVEVSVVVTNYGQADAADFSVGLWLDSPGEPTGGPDRTYAVTSLPAGQTRTLKFSNVMWQASGEATVWAKADWADQVDESDETNNAASLEVSVAGLPDISVEAIWLSGQPVAGESVDVHARIKNAGDVDAGPFSVALWLNRESQPQPGESADLEQRIDGLAAGESVEVVFEDVAWSSLGSQNLWVLADSLDEREEYSELNNAKSLQVSVRGRPDLVIDVIRVPAGLRVGQTASVEVVVRNAGSEPTGPFSVAFWADWPDQPVDSASADARQACSGLQAGESATVVFSVTYQADGAFTCWALADADGQVDESDEANNYKSQKVVVARRLCKVAISVQGQGRTEPAPGTYEIEQGEAFEITAYPAEGWQFAGWQGLSPDDVVSGETVMLAVDGDRQITAVFESAQAPGAREEPSDASDTGEDIHIAPVGPVGGCGAGVGTLNLALAWLGCWLGLVLTRRLS